MTVFANRLPHLRAALEASEAFGDRDYVVFADRDQRRVVTHPEHRRAVASVARVLREEYGVGPGDRVAILAANCPEWIVTFWATVSLGAIAVGLNGWWVGRRDPVRHRRLRSRGARRRPQAPRPPRGRGPRRRRRS